MRIAILKGDAPRHNYFTRQLTQIEGTEFLVVGHNRLKVGRLKKMLKKSPMTFINRVSKYIYYYIIGWNKYEARFFDNDIIRPPESKVDSFNSVSCIELLKGFEPDIILSFGIPIISKKVISIPKFGAINLHGGISPDYKGGNTIFWALYNNEVALAGATIHYMVEKVDSGKVISKVYPSIQRGDNELSVSCKTFKDASHEMVRIVKWVMSENKPISGIEQTSKGHLYLAKDRSIVKELLGVFKIKRHLKTTNLNQRIQRFYP